MTEPHPRLAAMTLFITDKSASAAFYRALLDSEPIHEDEDSLVFRCGRVMVNLLLAKAVPELIDPALPSEAGSTAVYTIPCKDVDARVQMLTEAGLTALNGPVDRPWGIRTASYQDPAGHIWELAQ